MAMTKFAVIFLLVTILVPSHRTAQIPSTATTTEVAQDVRIDCSSRDITVAIKTKGGAFSGLVYPKGLSKNSSCLAEYVRQRSPVRYKLPLRSCNTMSTDLSDGGVEYFNTIVVQPHLKLVTNHGRGFHIRCRYDAKDKTISNDMNISMPNAIPLRASAPRPGCSMKIYSGDPVLKAVAENVKIGDPLSLVVSLARQDLYGLRVTDCVVRDGLGWSEQRLVDGEGCPVDGEIMGPFSYNPAKTTAEVSFQAHKFPYTPSVYYQCNVQLCFKAGGGCQDVPPDCSAGKALPLHRRRREETSTLPDGSSPATIEVYSGLYVNEATDLSKADILDDVSREKTPDDPNSICISQRNFAIGIAIAGLVLMLAVVAAILVLLARRRKKGASTTGSSIYSGPYTNTAYSHSS
ncbi:cuticlin-4 [Bacillus rossius redtenbacheri]|uniref:cuticlin-4 n=1 Tax=Bacillus rossius redtenbacheri TaxID=93214 RepID=UPI002FDE9EC1